ncbi:MAG TPA: FAD-linked oxidase C-terminal domain-containing protein [Burkholderiaceae bacterium]|nr:FAD-linked oxidase C-terminal domain-containing protein [Burkholderiaceae bacterium]
MGGIGARAGGGRPLAEAFVERLRTRFGDRFSTAAAVREHHGRDESPFEPVPPDAVVFATSTEDVVEAVKACQAFRVPLIPYGAGSSLEGHLLPIHGGVSVDLTRMNRVLAVQAEDLTATVQAGVTRKQLNTEIRDTGLFFPIDPGADATLGGMASTRASGTNAVRYGTMRENVLALTVVTADGKVIRTARRAKKSSAGYDLTRLFVGAEGTLGVITEVTVKLYPQPESISAAICNFPTVADAVRTTIQTIQLGIPVARCELLDATGVRAVNAYSKLALRETPMLLFEFHGSATAVREQAEAVQHVARDHHGLDFQWATQPEERSRLWQARHNAYFATLQLKPGSRAVSTDVCVPISRLAECIGATQEDLDRAPIITTIIGHVGDGNFHVQMIIDPNSPRDFEIAEELNERLVKRALSMDGTCTGEHGVGLHKMGFVVEEHGEDAIEMMARIKRAFDPLDIMNPGKVVRR